MFRFCLCAFGALTLVAGCAAQSSGGAVATGGREDYPQAPMVVRPAVEGGFSLYVCATGEASEERGAWIESVTLTDLTLDPPVVVWEIVLPDDKRENTWSWDPHKPWVVTLGKTPANFQQQVALKSDPAKDTLYQVSVIGWDPGELLFAVEKDGRVTHYDPVSTRKIGTPLLPCEQPAQPAPAG